MYQLLSATPSPYARKVRIALIEKGLPFELVTEVPWNDDSRTGLYNPLEKLPVLIPESGEPVYESSLILEWLEFRHPEPALFPQDPEQRLAARRFEVLADGVCDAVVLLLFERLRGEERQSRPWIERQLRKVRGGVAAVAERAPADGGFLVGGRFGLADLAVGTMLGYLEVRLPEHDWRRLHPGLVPLFDRLGERESFRRSVPAPQSIDAGVV